MLLLSVGLSKAATSSIPPVSHVRTASGGIRAGNRHKNKSLEERFVQARDHKTPDIELSEEFKRASDTEDSGKTGGNDSRSRKPRSPSDQQRFRRNRRDPDKDRDL